MEMGIQDYLKKTLIDTQERVRDFMNYSMETDDDDLKEFFEEYAESEGWHARQLQDFIKEVEH